MSAISKDNVIQSASRLMYAIDAIRRRIGNATQRGGYHAQLIAAIEGALFVYAIRSALQASEESLSTRLELVDSIRLVRTQWKRATSYDSRSRTIPGKIEKTEQFDIPAITAMRDEIAAFRQLAPQLAQACEQLRDAIADLAFRSFADVKRGWKPYRYTREMVSFLRMFIDDKHPDNTLSTENVVCGLVYRNVHQTKHGVQLLRWAKYALARGIRQPKGKAPARCDWSRFSDEHNRATFRPFKAVEITRRQTGIAYGNSNGNWIASALERPAMSKLYRTGAMVGVDYSRTHQTARMMRFSRSYGNCTTARYLTTIALKGLVCPADSTPQVLVGDIETIEIDSQSHGELPIGYSLRRIEVRVFSSYDSTSLDGVPQWAFILVGPNGRDISWAHITYAVPEQQYHIELRDIVGRFNRAIVEIAASAERLRLARLSAKEREAHLRKERLTLACEIRRLGEFTFQDSRRAGNCETGTQLFCSALRIPHDVCNGHLLARRWVASGYQSEALLRNVVQHVKQQRQASLRSAMRLPCR